MEHFDEQLNELAQDMDAYRADVDVSYEASHIGECMGILKRQLGAIVKAKSLAGVQALVDEAVLALNGLNERCEGDLIETDAREMICQMITEAGYRAGFNAMDEDLTEALREW